MMQHHIELLLFSMPKRQGVLQQVVGKMLLKAKGARLHPTLYTALTSLDLSPTTFQTQGTGWHQQEASQAPKGNQVLEMPPSA